MKSPMVQNLDCIPDKSGYSELQVLRSAAGYYVGTLHTDENGFVEPGSRDSGYFGSREEAARYLAMVESAANPQEYLRDQP
jgi:hypothetical protein